MTNKNRQQYWVLLLLALITTGWGCAAKSTAFRGALQKNLYQNDFSGQFELLKSSEESYGSKDRLLWYFDLCSIGHYAADFKESNKYCQKADSLSDELYTQSISQHAISFLSNDTTIAYAGENFERIFINTFGMLNYTLDGDLQDALVEAKRLDNKIHVALDDEGDKVTYRKEAFGRYVSGLIYESKGEINDAYIDYRAAFDAYEYQNKKYNIKIPTELAYDLLRTAKKLGFNTEYEKYKNKYFLSRPENPFAEGNGEVVIFVESGFAPYKISEIEKMLGADMAVPKFKNRPSYIQHIRAKSLDSTDIATSVITADISAIAITDLDDRMAKIRAKGVGRVVAKAAATELAGSFFGNTGKLIAGAAMGAAEVADTRSWSTLPAEIHMLRISLPAGSHDIALKYYSYYGEELCRQLINNVDVKKNKRSFLMVKAP